MTSYAVDESVGTVNIPVERIGSGKQLKLFYDIHYLSADDGDFNELPFVSLKWKDGQTGVRSIPITDDMKMEKTEAIRITLKQNFSKEPTSLIDPKRREFILIIKDDDEGNH